MILITIVDWVYKPTYNSGTPLCISLYIPIGANFNNNDLADESPFEWQ